MQIVRFVFDHRNLRSIISIDRTKLCWSSFTRSRYNLFHNIWLSSWGFSSGSFGVSGSTVACLEALWIAWEHLLAPLLLNHRFWNFYALFCAGIIRWDSFGVVPLKVLGLFLRLCARLNSRVLRPVWLTSVRLASFRLTSTACGYQGRSWLLASSALLPRGIVCSWQLMRWLENPSRRCLTVRSMNSLP